MTIPRSQRFPGTRGLGLAEYVIVLALIAIIATAVITLFGDRVREALGLNAPPPAVEAEAPRPGARPAPAPGAQLPDGG